MQFLKFTATLTDKEWIKGNKDRETYRDHKAEICDRTESRNDGKEDVFFISEVRGTRIKGAALVMDEKNLCRRVEDYMRKISVSADVSTLNEVTFADWFQQLRNAERGDYMLHYPTTLLTRSVGSIYNNAY